MMSGPQARAAADWPSRFEAEYGFNAERLITVARKPEGDAGNQGTPNHGMQATAFGRG